VTPDTCGDAEQPTGGTLTRREMLWATAAAGTVAMTAGEAAAATDAARSPLVQAGDDAGLGWSPPDVELYRRHGSPSWIVRYSDAERSASIDEWVGGDESNRYTILHSDYEPVSVVAAPPGHIGVSGFDRWRGQGLLSKDWVKSVDLDIRVSYIEPVVPATADQWSLHDTLSPWQRFRASAAVDDGLAHRGDMPEATINDVREYTNADDGSYTGGRPSASDITIAVFDTGADDHSVFNDSLGNTRIQDASADYTTAAKQPTVGEDGIDVVADGNGHGNWCAAAAAGDGDDLDGYAPDADLVIMKVLTDDGSGSAALIAEAVRYVAEETAADLGTMSLGSPIYSDELDRAISYAAGADIPICVAAGNDREGSRWVASPADSPDAITVTATTAEPPADARSAAFHNIDPDNGNRDLSAGQTQGRHIDVTAPGCKIEAETPDGDRRLTGTSMATPCVAGGLALVMADDNDVRGDPAAAKARLSDYAAPVPAAGASEAGHGMLDVKAAIDESEPEETQLKARDDKAVERDNAHQTISAAEGGLITQYL
jgi:hypothetical protein